MQFKDLSLEDKDIINQYSKNSNIESYEYLFSSLYMWRKLNKVKYNIIDGALVIEKNEEGKGTFYAQPIGYRKEDLVKLIDKLIERNEEFTDREYLFGDVDENFINDIKKYTDYKIEVKEDVDDFEYVYKTEDLINLRGRKYHGKKNHYNSFVKTYEYEIKDINNDHIKKDCINLLHKWHDEMLQTVDREMCMEIDAIRDVFKEIHELDLETIAVYVDDELAGFAIGELVNDKLAVIHAERGEIQYKGIYSFINKEFLVKSFSKTEFVNRQEDAGNAGLRKSKKSYYPTKMVKKYLVKIM